MKKYTLAFALAVLLPVVSAGAYEYGQPQGEYNSAHRPVVKTATYKRAATSRRTGGYNNIVTNNFYYGQPAQYYTQKANGDDEIDAGYIKSDYRGDGYYAAGSYDNSKKQTNRTIKSYSSQERKFFLAHPFFQPLKGRVGSVTDFSYARNNFDFDLLNGKVLGLDPNVPSEYNKIIPSAGNPFPISGKEETSMFAVKEDLSYGLTDTLALILMAQYDKTKVTFKDWSVQEPSDTSSDSGLNLFGIGLQNRFVDNKDWIVMGDASFQHQKDTANTFMGELKAGYKIDTTTIYGIGRVSYTNLIKGDIYGAYVDNPSGDWMILAYKTDVKNIFQAEGGLGAFSVLNKYFTLNGELMFGHYDWHNQLNIKGALGVQPADSFALNLYASTALYDSAKGKTREYINYDVNPDNVASSVVYTIGDYNIKKYNEWKVGVQAILYF